MVIIGLSLSDHQMNVTFDDARPAMAALNKLPDRLVILSVSRSSWQYYSTFTLDYVKR